MDLAVLQAADAVGVHFHDMARVGRVAFDTGAGDIMRGLGQADGFKIIFASFHDAGIAGVHVAGEYPGADGVAGDGESFPGQPALQLAEDAVHLGAGVFARTDERGVPAVFVRAFGGIGAIHPQGDPRPVERGLSDNGRRDGRQGVQPLRKQRILVGRVAEEETAEADDLSLGGFCTCL